MIIPNYAKTSKDSRKVMQMQNEVKRASNTETGTFERFFQEMQNSDFYSQKADVNKYFSGSVEVLKKTVEKLRGGLPCFEELLKDLTPFEDFEYLVDQIFQEKLPEYYDLMNSTQRILQRSTIGNQKLKGELEKKFKRLQEVFTVKQDLGWEYENGGIGKGGLTSSGMTAERADGTGVSAGGKEWRPRQLKL